MKRKLLLAPVLLASIFLLLIQSVSAALEEGNIMTIFGRPMTVRYCEELNGALIIGMPTDVKAVEHMMPSGYRQDYRPSKERPGRDEPRYLGFNENGVPVPNPYFPPEVEDNNAELIAEPWKQRNVPRGVISPQPNNQINENLTHDPERESRVWESIYQSVSGFFNSVEEAKRYICILIEPTENTDGLATIYFRARTGYTYMSFRDIKLVAPPLELPPEPPVPEPVPEPPKPVEVVSPGVQVDLSVDAIWLTRNNSPYSGPVSTSDPLGYQINITAKNNSDRAGYAPIRFYFQGKDGSIIQMGTTRNYRFEIGESKNFSCSWIGTSDSSYTIYGTVNMGRTGSTWNGEMFEGYGESTYGNNQRQLSGVGEKHEEERPSPGEYGEPRVYIPVIKVLEPSYVTEVRQEWVGRLDEIDVDIEEVGKVGSILVK